MKISMQPKPNTPAINLEMNYGNISVDMLKNTSPEERNFTSTADYKGIQGTDVTFDAKEYPMDEWKKKFPDTPTEAIVILK